MKPIIDPRDGDIEDDASSTKQRSLFSLAGSLLAEISFPKLAVAWVLLIGLPGVALGPRTHPGVDMVQRDDVAGVLHPDGHFAHRRPRDPRQLRLVRRASAAPALRGELLVAQCAGRPTLLHRRTRRLQADRRAIAAAKRERGGAGLGPCRQRRHVGHPVQRGLVRHRRARAGRIPAGPSASPTCLRCAS